MVHETERAGHARDLVENLKLGDLQHLDGVVAVSHLQACPHELAMSHAHVCAAMLSCPSQLHQQLQPTAEVDLRVSKW